MDTYDSILVEMKEAMDSFSTSSGKLNGYQYEKQFRGITDKYNLKLFEASQGKIPKSKNETHKVKTSFGEIRVKKKGIH